MSFGILHGLRRRLTGWLSLRTALFGLGLLAGAALVAVFLDAALDLSEQARVLAPWLLLSLALAVLVWGLWTWRSFREEKLALYFERAQPGLGNQLINAVQLSKGAGSTAAQEFLRLEAIALGTKAASKVNVWPAVKSGVTLTAGFFGAALMGWVALAVFGQGVLRMVTPRFLDPHGDHPPYSRLEIEVTPRAAEVIYGGQLEIRAKVRPTTADKLWLVSGSRGNQSRVIMFLAPDKSFFQTLANVREPVEYFVTDGRARSHRFPIRIRYTPQITLVEVATVFPDYTGKGTRTARLSEEPQALPEETKVTFRVVSNRPLQSGELTLTPTLGGAAQQVALTPELQQSNIVSGGFVLTQAVAFSLSVRDVDRLQSQEPRQGRFNILPDEKPRLFVLEPGRDAVATPSIKVPFRVEATDDYGVSRVAWLRGFNRSIERPFNMKLTLKAGPQSVEGASALDFGQLGVRPGDVIDYYFEAADNYPKGPNLALSRPFKLQIISDEQYQLILRQAAARKALFEPYFTLDAMLRRLAERARNLEKRAREAPEADRPALTKEAQQLAKDLAHYESELGKLFKEPNLFDVEQAFRNTLTAQHSRAGQIRKNLEEALSGGNLDPKRLADAAEQLSQMSQAENEDVGQPAGQIAAVAQLLARANTFVKLTQQQAALAQMLRRFEEQTNALSRIEEMEMQELAYQQRRVEEGLRSWLASLPEMLAKVPDEEQYAPLRADVENFIKAVADAQIEQDLAQNCRNLEVLNGKSGYQLAQEAAEKMDALISKCSGLPGKAKMCMRFKPSLQQSLGNTLEQILAAMGAKPGDGQGGPDGYGLFNDDVALYGPNVELAGSQAGGRGQTGEAPSRGSAQISGPSRDNTLPQPAVAARARLQPDARFPLRYRELVGEYFKVIAESEAEKGGTK